MELLGPARVNGRDTLHLRVTSLPATIDLWVDATTYLPVRQAAGKPLKQSTVDHTWLPRSAANLAAIHLTPPAGFSRQANAPTPSPSPTP